MNWRRVKGKRRVVIGAVERKKNTNAEINNLKQQRKWKNK